MAKRADIIMFHNPQCQQRGVSAPVEVAQMVRTPEAPMVILAASAPIAPPPTLWQRAKTFVTQLFQGGSK